MERVADGRKRKYDDVEPLAQGRVWLGSQAKQNGFMDEIRRLRPSTVELVVKQRAKIARTSDKVTLVTYPPRRTLFELLVSRSSDSETWIPRSARWWASGRFVPTGARRHYALDAVSRFR